VTAARLLPGWLRGFQAGWLRPDAIAGLVVWSVVTPQAVAYAQIAGLPPEAGLMAARCSPTPCWDLASSRRERHAPQRAAVSAAAVGPLAHGNAAQFAALSAALAQIPSLLGVQPGEGNFFPALADVLGELGDIHGATLAVGLGSIAVLLVGRRLARAVPSTLVVLVLAVAVSALPDLPDHGVAVVGSIPNALPDPAIPHVPASDLVALVAPALGVLIVTAEAVGVARALAVKHGYRVEPNRDLIAIGASNALAGLSSGFVQPGGASQTAAADGAGARSQLATVIAAVLILLTGAFLAPLFKDLPEATLAAIVVVAVSGF
jgi:sulfate permease, SulP family